MLKKIVNVFAVVVFVFVVVVALRPSEFKVSRSAAIAAAPSVVFPHVNDLHLWEAWSPWIKLDPQAKTSYEGPATGEGSVFKWDGNKDVGTGSMTIIESRTNELVRFRLDFIKPFAGTSEAEFTFVPDGNGTVVTWGMSGKNNFVGKAMSLFMDCDKFMGAQFEKGLSQLKSVVEPSAK